MAGVSPIQINLILRGVYRHLTLRIPFHDFINPRANGAERRSGRKARGEGTNYSARLFTPGERKALAKSKVHQ